jgi:hypothetical protein
MNSKSDKIKVDLNKVNVEIVTLNKLKDPLKYLPKLTFQGFSLEIVDQLTCIICQEVFKDPVTTVCRCQVTLCESCFKLNHNRCPICRSHTYAEVNKIMRAKIDDQDVVCECKMKYKSGKKDDHVLNCEKAALACSKCKKTFNGPNLRKHLAEAHTLEILMYFGRISVG